MRIQWLNLSGEVKFLQKGFGLRPEGAAGVKAVVDLSRVGRPGSADDGGGKKQG